MREVTLYLLPMGLILAVLDIHLGVCVCVCVCVVCACVCMCCVCMHGCVYTCCMVAGVVLAYMCFAFLYSDPHYDHIIS